MRIFISSLLFLAGPFALAQQPAADLVAKALAREKPVKNATEPTAFLSHERSTRTSGHLWIERVVETPDGDLRRLLSVDGRPITPAMAKAEEERLAHIVAHPDAFHKANTSGRHDDDLIDTVPKMFLFSYDGIAGDCTKIRFKSNPSFTPTTYEQRVVHALEGVILIKQPEDRLCSLDARIAQHVEFGYGLLGHVGQGGTITMTVVQTAWGQWVTSELHIHVNAKLLMLKSLSKDQDDTRTDFVRLPAHLTLAEAAEATHP